MSHPSIIIHRDPEGINKREFVQCNKGEMLLDALIRVYGHDGFTVPTLIFKGSMIEENMIDQLDFDQLNQPLVEYDIINIVHRPLGTELIYAIVTAVLVVALTPTPSPPPVPENPNFQKTNESPNNRLTGQTNLARPQGRIPDIYGRMRVYPDLGAKTVTEYISHVKFVTEYLIIGRGSYQIEDLKSSETGIDDIKGTSHIIYSPNQIIPRITDATRSNEVNGQLLKAPNETGVMTFSDDNLSFSNSFGFGVITNDDIIDTSLGDFSALAQGDQFTITNSASNDGTYTFESFTETLVSGDSGEENYYYTIKVLEAFTIESVGATLVDFLELSGSNTIGAFVVSGKTSEIWLDFIANRGLVDRRNGSNVAVTLEFDIILDELDDAGLIISTQTITKTFTDNNIDQRFYTVKVVPPVLDARYQVSCQRQTETVDDSAYYDDLKWSGLTGIGFIDNFAQGNVTSVLLTTQATDQATQSQERKFNAVVTRKLRTYDTNTSSIVESIDNFPLVDAIANETNRTFLINVSFTDVRAKFLTLTSGDVFTIVNSQSNIHDGTYTLDVVISQASEIIVTVNEPVSELTISTMDFIFPTTDAPTVKMADALLHHLTDPLIGNKQVGDLDLDDLYTIQDNLDNVVNYDDYLGRFSYSFSAEKSSVKDELITIANSCRCYITKMGNRIGFTRDETLPNRTTLFNGRNKKPNSEKKTYRLQKPTDPDGIQLQWVYEDTGESFTVHFPEDESALNPKKIEGAGIRNFKQAWNRAKIEYNKLRLQRSNAQVTVTKDGLNLSIGDRIANADGTDVKTQSGEVKDLAGLEVVTYDAVDFKGNADAVVILRNENASTTEEITVTPRNDGFNGFIMSNAPVGFTIRVRGDLDYQIGTLYTFALTNEQKIKDYVIQKITPKDQHYVTIDLLNYTDSIYLPDTEIPPTHETITEAQ